MDHLDYNNPVNVHFIGIGGSSMSGLASILISRGFKVSGSDAVHNAATKELEEKGVRIGYPQSPDNIPEDTDLVVYTAAIHDDDPELSEARRRGIPTETRAVLLGQIMKQYGQSVNVSGTHGKTTTTSIITDILISAGMDPTVSVGGVVESFGSNMRIGSSDVFVTEACEYTNSFLHSYPTIAVILNIEEDHLDFFKDIDDIRKSFKAFADLLPENGTLVINSDIEGFEDFRPESGASFITYGTDPDKSDYLADNVSFDEKGMPYVGAGRNIDEAMRPYYFIINGYKFAFVNATRAEKNIMTPEATDTSGGVFRCYDETNLINLIKEIRSSTDYVIAIIHYGKE